VGIKEREITKYFSPFFNKTIKVLDMSGIDEQKPRTSKNQGKLVEYRFYKNGVNEINILLDLVAHIRNNDHQNLRDLQHTLQVLEDENRFRDNEFSMLSTIIGIALEGEIVW
jgi:hypothetical protein